MRTRHGDPSIPGQGGRRGRRAAGWGGLALGMAFVLAGCAGRPGRFAPVRVQESMPVLIGFDQAADWSRSTDAEGREVLVSPRIETAAAWNELIVSWNVEPAAGAGVVVEAVIEAEASEPSSRSYQLGAWSLDGAQPVVRSSVRGQRDAFGEVKTDTLVLRESVRAFRLRLTLVGELARHPDRLRLVTVSLCDAHRAATPRPPRREVWGRTLDVPERSQVAYPGGRGWCSPTSVSMLLAWWAGELNRPELDHDVPEVAEGVFDPAWPGTGNWPFNMAYAGATPGLRACAARLPDLRAVEDLVAAGIPVVLSVNAPALRGKPVTPDGGHLVICVGFTAEGDLVVNDPWARLEEGQRVRRVYPREYVERAWDHAHRLAYLIAPAERAEIFTAVWR